MFNSGSGRNPAGAEPARRAPPLRDSAGRGRRTGRLLGDAGDTPDAELPWRILVVDDDIDIHKVTRMALLDFEFEGRGVEIQSAFSAADARTVFKRFKNIAIALVDVVMETDHAGIDFVDWVRANSTCPVRLLVRSGEPGAAPPTQIAAGHEINGYLDKTLLPADRLKAQMIIELRAYAQTLHKAA